MGREFKTRRQPSLSSTTSNEKKLEVLTALWGSCWSPNNIVQERGAESEVAHSGYKRGEGGWTYVKYPSL